MPLYLELFIIWISSLSFISEHNAPVGPSQSPAMGVGGEGWLAWPNPKYSYGCDTNDRYEIRSGLSWSLRSAGLSGRWKVWASICKNELFQIPVEQFWNGNLEDISTPLQRDNDSFNVEWVGGGKAQGWVQGGSMATVTVIMEQPMYN